MNAAERLARSSHIAADGCLLWTGAFHSFGYGTLRWDNKVVYAHRLAWVTVKGPIPSATPTKPFRPFGMTRGFSQSSLPTTASIPRISQKSNPAKHAREQANEPPPSALDCGGSRRSLQEEADMTVTARKIRREAAKLNPLRKRRKLKVDAQSYFTKKYTEARLLHLPAYAKLKDERRAKVPT